MPDEKDRLGDTLHKKEKAEEDRFIQERDAAALERLRKQQAAAKHAAHDATLGRCPRCGEHLVHAHHQNVTVEQCPAGHGMWLDKKDQEHVASRERDSWLGRIIYPPRR